MLYMKQLQAADSKNIHMYQQIICFANVSSLISVIPGVSRCGLSKTLRAIGNH